MDRNMLETLKLNNFPFVYHSAFSFTKTVIFHRAFTGEFTHHKDEGTYTCVVCGALLFR